MIYEYTNNINYISLQVAESTNDTHDILSRLYNNNVQIDYTIDEKEKVVHILYIEALEKRKKCGTNALQLFLYDFNGYNIELESLFYLEEWYKRFGFDFKYHIDEMFCCKMILERGK